MSGLKNANLLLHIYGSYLERNSETTTHSHFNSQGKRPGTEGPTVSQGQGAKLSFSGPKKRIRLVLGPATTSDFRLLHPNPGSGKSPHHCISQRIPPPDLICEVITTVDFLSITPSDSSGLSELKKKFQGPSRISLLAYSGIRWAEMCISMRFENEFSLWRGCCAHSPSLAPACCLSLVLCAAAATRIAITVDPCMPEQLLQGRRKRVWTVLTRGPCLFRRKQKSARHSTTRTVLFQHAAMQARTLLVLLVAHALAAAAVAR